MTTCHTCHKEFENFKELALHISRVKHKKGRKWAANFIMKVQERPEIKKVAENPDYVPTEYGDENRRNAKRELSGENEYAPTICPTCDRKSRQLLPVEFIHNSQAWQINGVYVVSCKDHENIRASEVARGSNKY